MQALKQFLPKKLRAIHKSKKVRSDVVYHIMLESHLRRAFEILDVSSQETDEILKMVTSAEPKAKKKLFSLKKNTVDNAPFVLRRLVHAHLNYILMKAKLNEVKDEILKRLMEQQDVVTISQDYPEALDARALPPDQAILSLNQLLAQVDTQLDDLEKSLIEREKLLDEWLDKIQSLTQEFLESNKNESQLVLANALTEPQKKELMRLIACVTPESLLEPEPQKDSSDYALFQQIKKTVNK